MGRLLCSKLSLAGTVRTDSFQYPAATEVYSSTGIGFLTSAAPASGQVYVAMDQTKHFVTVNNNPNNYPCIGQCPTLTIIGKNTDSVSRPINYNVLINGVSQDSGYNNVSAGQFFIIAASKFSQIKPGDICEIRAWSSGTTLIRYDYTSILPNFSRYIPLGKIGRLLLKMTISVGISLPNPTQTYGTPQGGQIYLSDNDTYNNSNHQVVIYANETYLFNAIMLSQTERLLFQRYGDTQPPTSWSTSSTIASGLYFSCPSQFIGSISYIPTNIFAL